jgi:hypothetical protein
MRLPLGGRPGPAFPRAVLAAGSLLVLALAGPPRAAAQDVVPLDPMRPQPPEVETAPGDRSHELLDYECRSELGRRRVTLFANGTVRVWDGLLEKQRMTLGELGPDELAAFVRRLRDEDFSEVAPVAGTEGEWVERCTLELALAGQPARRYAFGRYDALPFALASTVRMADEVALVALPLDRLPPEYEPRPGDLLRRVDGVVFEVVRRTSDGSGLELRGKEQPLVLYVRPEDLRAEFDALISRRRP